MPLPHHDGIVQEIADIHPAMLAPWFKDDPSDVRPK
jgi:hypothetical protein